MRSLMIGLLAIAICGLVVSTIANAQQKNKRLQELVAKFPKPASKDGKLVDVDKKATDAAVAEFLKDVKGSIAGLVDMLSKKPNHVQVQHAIHAIVIRVGDKKYATIRPAAANALGNSILATLKAGKPKEVQVFLIRQLQLIGTAKEAVVLGPMLIDVDLAEPAAQALLGIKTDAAVHFRNALPKAPAKLRPLIVHGLGTLKDKTAAALLRKALADKNRDTRLAAAWALSRLPDAEAAEPLLKLANGAKGYERAQATDACFRLAENLIAAGDKDGARRIYSRLQKTRTGDAERFVREAAAKGLKSVK